MLRQLINKMRKPLTLEYVNNYLRSKGVATNERGENGLSFKLYDMNWELYLEKERLGIRNSFQLSDDIEYSCLLQAANKLNNQRWIVKAFIETFDPVECKEDNKEEVLSSIVFSFRENSSRTEGISIASSISFLAVSNSSFVILSPPQLILVTY